MMKDLDDATLLNAYIQATTLPDIDPEFIELLKQELASRGIAIPRESRYGETTSIYPG
jgi:hypothetical protein